MQTLMTMTWSQLLMAMGLILVCGFLMLVVLVQRGRGGGLVGAFGGAGGMSAFGAKTGDVFTVITIVFAGVFVVLSVLGNYLFDQSEKRAVASTSSTTTPAVVPAEIDPGTGLPAGLPKDAIPLDLPPGTPGQTQTIKIAPGANGGVQALPVTTPPQPDPAVTPIQPNAVPPPPNPQGSQTGAPSAAPATVEAKPADGTATPPKDGAQPPAEKPKEEPK